MKHENMKVTGFPLGTFGNFADEKVEIEIPNVRVTIDFKDLWDQSCDSTKEYLFSEYINENLKINTTQKLYLFLWENLGIDPDLIDKFIKEERQWFKENMGE